MFEFFIDLFGFVSLALLGFVSLNLFGFANKGAAATVWIVREK